MAPIVNKDSLKALVKEEVQAALKEFPIPFTQWSASSEQNVPSIDALKSNLNKIPKTDDGQEKARARLQKAGFTKEPRSRDTWVRDGKRWQLSYGDRGWDFNALREAALDPRDAPGHIEHAKIERVLKRLMQHAERDPAAGSEMIRRQDSETAWIMGYQSAVKRAAEELLDLYF